MAGSGNLPMAVGQFPWGQKTALLTAATMADLSARNIVGDYDARHVGAS
jgi:hypothetical protein